MKTTDGRDLHGESLIFMLHNDRIYFDMHIDSHEKGSIFGASQHLATLRLREEEGWKTMLRVITYCHSAYEIVNELADIVKEIGGINSERFGKPELKVDMHCSSVLMKELAGDMLMMKSRERVYWIDEKNGEYLKRRFSEETINRMVEEIEGAYEQERSENAEDVVKKISTTSVDGIPKVTREATLEKIKDVLRGCTIDRAKR